MTGSTMTPRELFAAYAAGRIGHQEMVDCAAAYPYAKEPATDGYDWMTGEADGPTWLEVTAAKRSGQISADDYEEIFNRRHYSA